MTSFSQRSFAAGELSPSLYARTDVARYQAGLRTCRNLLIPRHGGAASRPGTAFVASVKDPTTPVRLLKFVFNADQTYHLELGDHYLRVFRNGAPIVTTGVAAWLTATAYAVADLVTDGGVTYYCTAAHTSGAGTEPGVGATWPSFWYALTTTSAPPAAIYEIPTPYTAADVAGLQFVQSADVVTITHPSYAPRQLARTAHTRWTLTPCVFGPSVSPPASLTLSGGGAGGSTWYAVTALADAVAAESWPVSAKALLLRPTSGSPITLTWPVVTGASRYAVYKSLDGNVYGRIGTVTPVSVPTTDSTWDTGSATISTTTQDAWVAAGSQARNTLAIATAADRAPSGQYTVTGQLSFSASGGFPLIVRARIRVYYARNGEPRIDAGLLSSEASTYGAGTSSVTVTGTVTIPDLPGGYASLVIDLVPEVYGHESSTGTTFAATATGTSVAWTKGTTGYTDEGSVATDYTEAPPVVTSVFAGPTQYPSIVAYYQQRRLYASTTAEPEKVWASQTGDYGNFGVSTPLVESDAVSFTIAGRQVNGVRALLDLGRLVLFTAGGVFIVEGDANGVLTPFGVNLRQVGYNGIVQTLPPLPVGNGALFVQARGSIIRGLTAALTPYGQLQIGSDDLSLAASHLFDGFTVAAWDYAETPDSIAWVARSDGALLGLTFLREQEIAAWHRHDTDGAVEQVATVPEGTEDAVYLVVRRTVNGQTVRYVERMASRFAADVRDLCCLDASLAYDGRNVSATTLVLSGGTLWNEGETLTCTASAGTFSSGDVGNAVFCTDATGAILVRATITAYTSATVVTVRPDRTVPTALQGVATTAWARAVAQVAGLAHLEGKAVSIYADGFVVASPNNATYPVRRVTGGTVALDQPYAVIRVGLPFVADLQTLDLDTPTGPSLKAGPKLLANKVTLYLQQTRGVWAGGAPPTSDAVNPLEGLYELKVRELETMDQPVALVTDAVEVNLAGRYNNHARVFVRQVDPVPMTVLAVMPQGDLPG